MKICMFVSITRIIILIWLNSTAAQGYHYNKPQTYNGNYYHFLDSNAQQVAQIPQKYATLPAGSHVDAPTLHQQLPTNHQQLPYNPYTYSSPSNAATQHFITPQTNSAVHPINLNTNFVHANSNKLAAKTGDYVSQSEASELDQYPYPYKQKQIGDNRIFTRYITTCYKDGHCENSTQQPGASEPNNQKVLQKLRAIIEYGTTTCSNSLQNYKNEMSSQPNTFTYGKNVLSPAGNQVGQLLPPALPQQQQHSKYGNVGNLPQKSQTNSLQAFPQTQLPNRPPERRLYPYTEIVRPNNFN